MFDIDLLKSMLIIAISTSIISSALIQRIKEGIQFKSSKKIIIISFFVSMIMGFLFSITFTNISLINSLWVGLFSFLGADTLYKTFEDKIFSSFTNINNTTEIVRDDRND